MAEYSKELSPFEQRQIERNSKKVVSVGRDLKVYVSKSIAKQVADIEADIANRPEVQRGEKSRSSIMLGYILKGFAEEKMEREKKEIKEEDKRTPVEKLRENYIDINIPNRVKKVELPPVDGYMDYIDNGGIPVSTLIERGKLSDKDIARLAVSVQALNLELNRTKNVAMKVKEILKFKTDTHRKFKIDRIERLCRFIFNKDDYNTNEYKNLFAFYHQFKNKIPMDDVREYVPDSAMPYVAYVHGDYIGRTRQEIAKSLLVNS
jgi:hypothetical protein